jgi:hypothetical protein
MDGGKHGEDIPSWRGAGQVIKTITKDKGNLYRENAKTLKTT